MSPKIQKITPQRFRIVSLTRGNVAPIFANRTIRQIEFELEKAEHGIGMPYAPERVGQFRHMRRAARQRNSQPG